MELSLCLEYMHRAMDLAKFAAQQGEVPVGAVVVTGAGQVVGQGYNQMEQRQDATAHAEILALQQAAAALGRWRLQDCTLYVTLEPCPMCAGAMVQAQLGALVFGAPDNRAGAAGSLFNVTDTPLLNHRLKVTGGILEEPCAQLLRDFFQAKRRQPK